jgi:Acyl-CoA reductase (LuxC)
MQLKNRIDSFVALGKHLQSKPESWQNAAETAGYKNGWFTLELINIATNSIIESFLQKDILEKFCADYHIQDVVNQKQIGLVMAGNIPLVGFHDMLCVLLSGHKVLIKLSSKDEVLMKYVIDFLQTHHPYWQANIATSEMLKNCDAYIATGSDNSASVFEYYFNKYPSIIRKNRTSVAVIRGAETDDDLEKLADDVHLYFGLGCRNVTKLFVPKDYNFENMIRVFKKYEALGNHHKYKNNYDYNLALYLLNNTFYMTNGATILVENEQLFSPISCLHYQYYDDAVSLKQTLESNQKIQCIIGFDYLPFGDAQTPTINQFADGIDTMLFLKNL